MKLFLLIFCLVCISITTAQECTRKNDTYTQIAKPLKTKTAKRCTAKCEKSSDCVSWTWNKKEKMCYLIKEFDLAERTPWISGNCGEGEEEGCMKFSVTCGDGVRREFCFLCGDSFDSCQGTGVHPDCIFTSSDTCIPSGCRTGWMEFGGRCYYVAKETKKLSWNESVAECKKLDERSDLPSVGSQLEQDYIAQYPKDGYYIFLGATDKDNEGQWKWTDGRPWTYTKWASGEPNNAFGGTEDCAYMRRSEMKNEWIDIRCFQSYDNFLLMCSYNPGSSE